MEQRNITDEELAELQQEFPDVAKHTFHPAPGDEERVMDADVVTATVDGLPSILMPWIVTNAEKEMLRSGGTVWLRILGVSMPPVSLFVTE